MELVLNTSKVLQRQFPFPFSYLIAMSERISPVCKNEVTYFPFWFMAKRIQLLLNVNKNKGKMKLIFVKYIVERNKRWDANKDCLDIIASKKRCNYLYRCHHIKLFIKLLAYYYFNYHIKRKMLAIQRVICFFFFRFCFIYLFI